MKQVRLETPILFLIFNRPIETKIVFTQIRKQKPKKLYIAADGPRDEKEKKICYQLRSSILSKIDWSCQVKTLFRDSNLGCGKAIKSAIDWFFLNEKAGIILEDDCYPSSSFFYFCQAMLEKYEADHRMMHISGSQFIRPMHNKTSYYQSIYPSIWGWATWRESWEKYDFDIDKKPLAIFSALFKGKYFNSFNELLTRYYQILMLRKRTVNTWDYQWFFSIALSNGYTIKPTKNLTKNIGINGTHIKIKDKRFNVPLQKISFPLQFSPISNIGNWEDKKYSQHFLEKNVLKMLGQIAITLMK